ncbi:MAG: hypothetical protein Q9172_005003 [Xanthocarpia lactea]
MARAATILPNFIGLKFQVHNGKVYNDVTITEDMVGHKLGEFSPFFFSRSPSLAVIDGLLYQSVAVLGYLAVVLAWADLLWKWILSPTKRLATSLALATKIVTDFKGVRDLYVFFYGLLHRAPKQVLEFLAWIYFYPIDKDIATEMEPMDALMSRSPGPQLQKWPLIHGRSGRRHDTSREPRTRELDSCPWNDSGLWSYIESDHGEDTRALDESPTDAGVATNHQSQAPEPYRNRDTTTTVKVADAPSQRTAPTDADPTPDAITLRHRSHRQSNPPQRASRDNQAKTSSLGSPSIQRPADSQHAARRSPTVTDNINYNQKIKAGKVNRTTLVTHHEGPTRSTSSSSITTVRPSRADPLLLLRYSDSDAEERGEGEREGGEPNGKEPLVSTAVPTTSTQNRWALVFNNAKDQAEELDRFEDALGGCRA